jgi:hypothetical protein
LYIVPFVKRAVHREIRWTGVSFPFLKYLLVRENCGAPGVFVLALAAGVAQHAAPVRLGKDEG